ncbi:hypothetical protein [Nesterenkonia suensis]
MGEHLRITAHLATPAVGLLEHPAPLDGPLAWAYFQDAMARRLPMEPLTAEHAPDADLPLGIWEQYGTWGWRVSSAHIPVVGAHDALQIRRKPATIPMGRYARDREHHSGLGPHKARDSVISATHLATVSWDAEVTEASRLEQLLGLITHLGGHPSRDMGRVDTWEVTDGPPGGWKERPMPHPEGTWQGIRAPYWHPTRKAPALCP